MGHQSGGGDDDQLGNHMQICAAPASCSLEPHRQLRCAAQALAQRNCLIGLSRVPDFWPIPIKRRASERASEPDFWVSQTGERTDLVRVCVCKSFATSPSRSLEDSSSTRARLQEERRLWRAHTSAAQRGPAIVSNEVVELDVKHAAGRPGGRAKVCLARRPDRSRPPTARPENNRE